MSVPTFRGFSSVPKFSGAANINPDSVTNATVSLQAFTVNGLTTDMIPVVGWPGTAESADVRIISARITADNTLELAFYNFGGAPVNLGEFEIQILGL